MSFWVVTALEARRLRLLAGKPIAEVNRLWRLESLHGTAPDRLVPWSQVGAPVDYSDLERRERAAAKAEQAEALRLYR